MQSARAARHAKLTRLTESPAVIASTLFSCAAADATVPCGFAALPLPVVLRIFALLPADARARAAAVCSPWCWQLTVGPSAWQLWTELDLSETGSVTCTRTDAALEGAAARARGRLRTLKLRDFEARNFKPHTFTEEAVLRVVTANAGLEELTYSLFDVDEDPVYMTLKELKALLAAAPALQKLTAAVQVKDANSARALLRSEPPYAAMRLQDICVADTTAASPLRTAAGVIAFAEAVAACDSTKALTLKHANLEAPAALAALVDAVLTRRLRLIVLNTCTFAPAGALPQLARLLADGCTSLGEIVDSPTLFANAQEADLDALCNALKKSTLSKLVLTNVGLHPAAHMPMTVLLRRALASRLVRRRATVTVA